MSDVIHWEVTINESYGFNNIECLTYEHAIVTAHALEQVLSGNIITVNEITDDGRRIKLHSNCYGDLGIGEYKETEFRHANYPKIL